MSSLSLQKLPNSETVAAIVAAVGIVTERSFFALVDRGDEPPLDEAGPWLVTTVRFEDGPVVGSMGCWLPEDLAHALFDAFSGRDPSEPLPSDDQLADLVGEFSNMVCGTWLSRFADDRAFRLSPPIVTWALRLAGAADGRLWLSVNNRPLAIDLDLALVGAAAAGS